MIKAIDIMIAQYLIDHAVILGHKLSDLELTLGLHCEGICIEDDRLVLYFSITPAKPDNGK